VGENAPLEVGLIDASFIKEYIPIDAPPQLFGDLSRNPPVFVPVADKYVHTWPPAYRSSKEVEMSMLQQEKRFGSTYLDEDAVIFWDMGFP